MARQLPKITHIKPSTAANMRRPPQGPTPNAPSKTPAQSRVRPVTKPIPLLLWAAGFSFFASVGFVYWRFYGYASSLDVPEFDPSIDLNEVYNTTAMNFDDEVEWTEYWWGITRRRRKLARMAEGDVLESAAGTGRNCGFFDKAKVRSLIEVDKSQGMLDLCKEKWKVISEKQHYWKATVAFLVGDLAEDGIDKRLSPPELQEAVRRGKFDTVIQTMGLCSTNEPEKLLRNLGKMVKEDGRILLLEHGKGYYDWINRYLDVEALHHAQDHGCWWNRDIGAIVEHSGLEVVEMKRFMLGTTWWFVLKRPVGYENASEPDVKSNEETTRASMRWWRKWMWDWTVYHTIAFSKRADSKAR